MKRRYHSFEKSFFMPLGLALAFSGLFSLWAHACTIFMLTDTNRALFCNNEDWSNPKTRVWFVPAGPKHYGCVYVGFDDGAAQGGINTEGLAFDAVAGYNEVWKADPNLPIPRGNQEFIETCATVPEAIAYWRGCRVPEFSHGKFLIADRTGASVIIGAKDGKFQAEESKQCRGFGYGAHVLDTALAEGPAPTLSNAAKILKACLQKGKYATKYSNVFDLRSGDIFLYPFPERDDPVKLNLAAELAKGGHYYDMPQIREQLSQSPRPLLDNMERFLLEKYQPIPDREPKVTAHILAMLQDSMAGNFHPEDYTPEAWKEQSANLKQTQAALQSFGRYVSLTLVDRREEDGNRTYRYRMEFEKATLLQQFVLDKEGKVVSGRAEEIR
ncbi:MAG TPA: hypothetical protein VL361_16080 [Candidatus Limnocylindrales bacterium]|nr:hypothetical protein [Candidatus Limnocylindrales bacterium]